MEVFHTAIVAGATGFIGSALVQKLQKDGVEVFCLVRSDTRSDTRILKKDGIQLIELKTFSGQEIANALKGISADVFINLASYGVQPGDRDIDALLKGNIDLIANIIVASKELEVKRIIHTGSCFEYGPILEESPLSESHPIEPISVYGAAKAASVILGNALAKSLALDYVTLRLFGVYGPGEHPDRLIPYLIDKLNHDQAVDLTPGEQVRDLLYISDVVDAYIEASKSTKIESYAVYNVCSGRGVTIAEVSDTVARKMMKSRKLLKFGERSYRKDENMWIVGDNRSFLETADWTPKVSLGDGIQKMVENLS